MSIEKRLSRQIVDIRGEWFIALSTVGRQDGKRSVGKPTSPAFLRASQLFALDIQAIKTFYLVTYGNCGRMKYPRKNTGNKWLI